MQSNSCVRWSKATIFSQHMIKRRYEKALNLETMNQNIVKLQYAVRGPLIVRAGQIEAELAKGTQLPFKKVVRANLGDAHAMGQRPLTFIRQLQACAACPEIIEKFDFPDDLKQRALYLLKGCAGGSVGSYTMSLGIERIRQAVACYIQRRDGFPAEMNNVVLSTGASSAIKAILQLFIQSGPDQVNGVMVPIPQYPLYSATLAEYAITKVDYFLDEDNNWGLDIAELERSLQCAKCKVKALVVINPGNPTGQVLSRENIECIIKFAHANSLLILADEVYQANIWAEGSEFHSFKKVLCEMGEPFSTTQELVSFMSASKGYTGECGVRAGWMEVVNMNPEVQAHLYKALSAMLCPNVLGQFVLHVIAEPPKVGQASFCTFQEEKCEVLESLKKRATLVESTFNQMKGFKCNILQGAMYAFPKIELSEKAIEAAKAKNVAPDVYYCFKLLEECGICVVPGSGFGQRPGTYHFRTTILPQINLLKEMLETFKTFQEKFSKEHE